MAGSLTPGPGVRATADLADPDRAVAGADEHRAVAAERDRARAPRPSRRPAWASKTDTAMPHSVGANARGPVGGPDAAHDRVASVSAQENWRSAWRIVGRSRPITSGRRSSSGSGTNAGSAAFVGDLADQLDRGVGDGPL